MSLKTQVVRTACRGCHGVCQVLVHLEGGRVVKVTGDPRSPTSRGYICYVPRLISSGITMGRLPVSDIYGFGGEMPVCILIWGCNITETGAADGMCGGMLNRAIKKARKIIVIDPRRIRPAENADHWLQLRPGTEGALALAFINAIITEDLVDHEFVDKYTVGYDRLVEHIKDFTLEWA